MRRLALFACLVAVVASTGTAAGALDRTPRSIIENPLTKVRPAPDLPGRSRTRARVIVTLDDPPLAAAAFARRLAGFGPRRKLNVASSFSRSYLAGIDAAQGQAIAALRAEIPEAVVSRWFRVLLNGLTVSVPYERLPELMELDFAKDVYPSLSYTLSMNRGPAVIGAAQFSSVTGARGEGV